MSTTQSLLKSIDFGRLMRAAEGLTQWRVLGLSFLTWLAGGLVMAGGQMLATRMGSVFMALLFLVVAGVVFSAGMSAVGILLQDQAKNAEQRSMMDALKAGMACVPKFILLGLLVLALMLVMLLVAGIVYFICKIPFLGPILLFFAHPAMVIVASVFFVALYWVAAPLLAPALWDGRSIKGAVSLVVSVVRARLVPLVLMLLALYIVITVIALVVFSGFIPGFAYMTALASAIIGPTMMSSMGGMGGGGMGALGAMSSSGYMVAGTLSTVILFAVLMALTMQVMIMGMNIIYLMVTDGLDEKATEDSLQAGIDLAREKARQAQEIAREAADKVRHATHTDGVAPVVKPAPTPTQSPASSSSAFFGYPEDTAAVPAAAVASPVTSAAVVAGSAVVAAVDTAATTAATTISDATKAVTSSAPQEGALSVASVPGTTQPMAPAVSTVVASAVVRDMPAAADPLVPSASVVAPAVAGALPRCNSCFEAVSPTDEYCEHCGAKLH